MRLLFTMIAMTVGMGAQANIFDRLEACETQCTPRCMELADDVMRAARSVRRSCNGGGTNVKLDCLQAAKQAGFSAARSERTCKNANRGTAACIVAAKDAGFSYDRNEKTCTNATPFVGACIRAAKAAGFSHDRNQRTCTGARRDTADCITRTKKMGWSYTRIEKFCKPN